MNVEGEYAVDKGQRAHRIASGVVYGIWLFGSFWLGGLEKLIRTGLFFLLPIACIWFSDALASYTGVILGRGRYIDERSHPVFLRWAGWFLLFIVPLFWIAMCLMPV